MLLTGTREASEEMADRLIGASNSVLVMPGGVHEMSRTQHEREVVRCPSRLGFVRLAMRHGVSAEGLQPRIRRMRAAWRGHRGTLTSR